MKKTLTYLRRASIIPLLILGYQQLAAQDIKKFRVSIETNGKYVVLKSDQGSEWETLRFKLTPMRVQDVDAFGLANLRHDGKNRSEDTAEYLFSISSVKDKIILKGIKGTSWKELIYSFEEGKPVMINENGME